MSKSKNTTVQSEVMIVTPEEAQAWLGANHKNRRIRSVGVSAYAKDMAAGRWTLNGESIKIDKHGNLVDGQHRLSAVIESDSPVEMLVVTGLEPEAMDTVDTGMKRTTADVLGMGGEKNQTILAAMLRRLVLRSEGRHIIQGTAAPTMASALAYLGDHSDVRYSAEFAANSGITKIIAPSVIGCGHWLFGQIDTTARDFFMGRIIDEDVPPNHPARTLKGKMIAQRLAGKRPTSDETMYYLIRSWNLYRNGETPTRIHLPREGLSNANFPMPR